MKKLLTFLGLSALIAFTGCKTAPGPITNLALTTSVTLATQWGSSQYPTAVPFIQVADVVICAAAANTAMSPDALVAAIANSPEGTIAKTPEGILVVNGIVALYTSIWDSYGSNQVANSAALQAYLNDLCIGIKAGLPATAAAGARVRAHLVP
jgi:hypothetical protein